MKMQNLNGPVQSPIKAKSAKAKSAKAKSAQAKFAKAKSAQAKSAKARPSRNNWVNAGGRRSLQVLAGLMLGLGLAGLSAVNFAAANEQLPWGPTDQQPQVITPGLSQGDGYRNDAQNGDDADYGDTRGGYGPGAPGNAPYGYGTGNDNTVYRSPQQPGYPSGDYANQPGYSQPYQNQPQDQGGYGQAPYPPQTVYPQSGYPQTAAAPQYDQGGDGTYSTSEIRDAGHRFFGRVSEGLASVIEYAFQRAGQPNGYILGEDAGGAFIAGLRYGEGILHTKDAGTHKVFWQGPSIGYDFGAEGSKTMILVYNMRHPDDIYQTFGGVAGAAYLVGGVGITFQQNEDVILAPIRSGLGLRIGANLGYLKYTREPTWNPF